MEYFQEWIGAGAKTAIFTARRDRIAVGVSSIIAILPISWMRCGSWQSPRLHCPARLKILPGAGFLVGLAVADVVQPLEGRDDFFVVRDHHNGGLILLRHLV